MRNRIWTDRILESLPETILFQGLRSEELPALLEWLQARQSLLSPGQYLWEVGQLQQGLWLLQEGQIRIHPAPFPDSCLFVYGDLPNRSVRKAPAVIGVGAALDGQRAWDCSARAETEVTALALRTDRLRYLVGVQQAEVSANLQRFLFRLLQLHEQEMEKQRVRMSFLLRKSMRGKLAQFLLSEAQQVASRTFRLRGTQEALSYLLQVSRPSMLRECTAMQEEGLLRMQGNQFELLDWQGLQQAASNCGRISPAWRDKI